MAKKRPNENGQPRVLVAEDDDEMRTLIQRALQKDGYEVTAVDDGASLITHLGDTIEARKDESSERYDLVISDIRMPGVFGLSVLEGFQNMDDVPPIILITAFGDAETHARAEELGALAMLDKPFKMADLMSVVRNAAPPNQMVD